MINQQHISHHFVSQVVISLMSKLESYSNDIFMLELSCFASTYASNDNRLRLWFSTTGCDKKVIP